MTNKQLKFQQITQRLGGDDFFDNFEGGDSDWIAVGNRLRKEFRMSDDEILEFFKMLNNTEWDNGFTLSELKGYIKRLY